MLINPNDAYAGQSIGPGSGYQVCRCAHRVELTVCQHTPSSAAMAETVVRSIINRRNIGHSGASSTIVGLPTCPGPD